MKKKWRHQEGKRSRKKKRMVPHGKWGAEIKSDMSGPIKEQETKEGSWAEANP